MRLYDTRNGIFLSCQHKIEVTRPLALVSLLKHFFADITQNFYLNAWLLPQLLHDLSRQPSRLGDQHFVCTCSCNGLTISEVELI